MSIRCFETFAKRISRLEKYFLSNSLAEQEHATINLLNIWSEFNGDLLLLFANGGFTTFSGTRITASNSFSRETLEAHLRSVFGGGRNNWFASYHASTQMVGYINRINPSNRNILVSSIGSTNNCSQDIRCIRNFFAHKNENTLAKVKTAFNTYDARSVIHDTIGYIPRWKHWSASLLVVAEACLQ